eukprot:2889341-Rhodomonas_salina.1
MQKRLVSNHHHATQRQPVPLDVAANTCTDRQLLPDGEQVFVSPVVGRPPVTDTVKGLGMPSALRVGGQPNRHACPNLEFRLGKVLVGARVEQTNPGSRGVREGALGELCYSSRPGQRRDVVLCIILHCLLGVEKVPEASSARWALENVQMRLPVLHVGSLDLMLSQDDWLLRGGDDGSQGRKHQ